MASFKIYNCDFGIKYNGVSYDFKNVASLEVEDNERNRLTRGSNAKDTQGLVYKDGLADPKRWTIPILEMPAELKALFDSIYNSQGRIECYCIDRLTGSSKIARNAILSNKPQQLLIDETPDSLQVALEIETFDSSEVHKS